MSQFTFPGNATTVAILSAVSAANTAAATSTGVDLIDYEGPIVITQNHGVSTGTLVGKIQDSADNSAFADIVPAVNYASEGTTVGVQQVVIQSKQVRRYIRYLGTVTTGPQVVAVTMTGVKKSV
jgi:cellobiose-specific phosphotransferase system component IIB